MRKFLFDFEKQKKVGGLSVVCFFKLELINALSDFLSSGRHLAQVGNFASSLIYVFVLGDFPSVLPTLFPCLWPFVTQEQVHGLPADTGPYNAVLLSL